MGQPHKHAEVIKAWADGAEVQYQYKSGDWQDEIYPSFAKDLNWRIKPRHSPDVIIEERIYRRGSLVETSRGLHPSMADHHNVRFVFDGETGALKSAEVLK